MKIIDLQVDRFNSKTWTGSDSEGHGHPVEECDSEKFLLRILTDEGVEGYYLSSYSYMPPSDKFNVHKKNSISLAVPKEIVGKGGSSTISVLLIVVKPIIMDEDPMCRERIFNKLYQMQRGNNALTDKVIAMVDLALWDLAGRYLKQPVYKLLGGHRTKFKMYASSMVGDHYEGGLNTPQAYADFAESCQNRGFKAFKLHTWAGLNWNSSAIVGKPDPKLDVSACRAVRERVGNDMELMLDCFHYYNRQEALYIGKEIEKLNFAWFEEPMDEYNTSSYIWLCEQLQIPVCGPEVFVGKYYTRAEWIINKACDICRAGVADVGGLTPLMKVIHLCEAFGVPLELHSPGLGNMNALSVMTIPGEYYESALLHPFLDFDATPPWLNAPIDKPDEEGYVYLSDKPGLGHDINFNFIKDNIIRE
jgi:L-alanine-DL-glutamate epimerase-like enolase superfamily enzyme